MRTLAALLLSLSTLACASARMVGRDVVDVAKAPVREWKSVAAATAVVGAALLLDDELARVARKNEMPALNRFTDAVEPFGGGHADKVMAGFLVYGVAAKNDRARDAAFDAIVSSMITSKAIVPAIKELAPRTRPSGIGDDQSFPSNHAAQAFAVATVFAAHYGDERPWVRWVAYGVASGVAFSRVYHDAHFTSDVLAGAAIGTLVGRTVVRTNRRERATWRVAPVRNGAVVSVTW